MIISIVNMDIGLTEVFFNSTQVLDKNQFVFDCKHLKVSLLTQKNVDMTKIREMWPNIPYFSKEIDEQIEINAHYRGYLKKQKADILAFKRDENLVIPEKVNYDDLSGLSNEVKAKFKQIKPKTMGQALRIDGITPAAVYILLSHVKRKSIKLIA